MRQPSAQPSPHPLWNTPGWRRVSPCMATSEAAQSRSGKRVIVVGGGVSGLSTALKLGRAGFAVTVLERDPVEMPSSADEAFEWDRRGAPQVRHSHAFLGRLYGLLRDSEPDLLAALLDAGATEMRFGDNVPDTLEDFRPEPGDEDLVMLACRRTTFEWVLRRTALAEGNVEFRAGVAAEGFTVAPGRGEGEPPLVNGVRLADGSNLAADLVVVAAGRRSALPEWLDAIGCAPMPEAVEDTGIIYLSRFYRLRDGHDLPPRNGLIGGDLGYLKYGVFLGDNRTFSLTLAAPSDDDHLRRLLSDDETFEHAARTLDVAEPYVDGRAEALTPVHVIAGLLNRRREFVVDGRPLAMGVHPVGDSVVCTNPLYGRGCTTGYWSAHLLSRAITEFPDDLEAQSLRFHALVADEIVPWYDSGVAQDAEARRVATALIAGEDPDADASDPRAFMRGVFRDGLAPALRFDPVVLRAFMRSVNLLTPPDALLKDQDVMARIFAIWNDRENRPPEPQLGPKTRAEMLDLMDAFAA